MDLPLAVYEEITGSSELPPPVDEADFERGPDHRRYPFAFSVRNELLPGMEGPASVGDWCRDAWRISILHEEA